MVYEMDYTQFSDSYFLGKKCFSRVIEKIITKIQQIAKHQLQS